MSNGEKKKRDKSKGSVTAGFILVGIGLVFLLSNLGMIPSLGETWPLFLIIIGASLLIGALRDKKSQDTITTIPPTEQTLPPTIG